MSYIIIIGMLMLALGITLIMYSKLSDTNRQLEIELSKLRDIYNGVMYDNCVLEDKIYKIRNLNLIDYSNNDYYKELLNINKQE